MVKNPEISGTEEFGLVTPTLGVKDNFLHYTDVT